MMASYINRLIKCGYSRRHAEKVCEDFVRNLPLIDLDFFVRSMELKHVCQV